MASTKPLVIQSGDIGHQLDVDTLLCGSGLDQSAAATLALGAVNATSIDIGKVGVLAKILGDLQTDGTEIVVGTTIFQDDSQFDGDVTFGNAITDKLTITGDSVVVGSSAAPDASSIMDIISTTKGFLPPRMTSTQRDAITSPAAGLEIYNETVNKCNFFNATDWKQFVFAPSDTLGTIGGVAFVIASGEIEADADFIWDNINKRAGIGTGTPNAPLEISGTGNKFLRVTSTDDSQTGIELFRPDNADTDWRILNDGGSLFFKSSSDDFTSTSPKMAIRVGGDALFDSTTVDISQLQIRVIRASNDAAQGMGIGFVHDTSNGNVGAAIVHERVGSTSQGKLHFATKSSTVAASDIPIRMTIDENGLVGIGTTSPTSVLSLQMGTGTGIAEASGKANVQTTAVGTDADTVEKDLLTYSLPANSLGADGKLVRITAWGAVTSASSKTIRLKFGSTVIREIATSSGGLDWRIDGIVIRTGATTQDAMATGSLDTVAPDTTFSTPTETLSGAVVIKLTGQNGTATANDIVAEGILVEYLN